jgi:hypothetical protein
MEAVVGRGCGAVEATILLLNALCCEFDTTVLLNSFLSRAGACQESSSGLRLGDLRLAIRKGES